MTAMEERMIKKLMTSMKCESCGKHYEVYNIDVLDHREDLWFLRVLCSTCHIRSLVAAVVKESGVNEVVTDLKEAELGKFRDSVVEADDLLGMHHFLKDFDGDFSRLFVRK